MTGSHFLHSLPSARTAAPLRSSTDLMRSGQGERPKAPPIVYGLAYGAVASSLLWLAILLLVAKLV